MEDPDSRKPPHPVIHWVTWNIPGDQTSPREGLQKQDRLDDPSGLRQGPTTSDVLAAAKGHVVGCAELVGTFKRPDHPSRP